MAKTSKKVPARVSVEDVAQQVKDLIDAVAANPEKMSAAQYDEFLDIMASDIESRQDCRRDEQEEEDEDEATDE